MARSARIGLAAAFLLAGATVAIAQNGPPTGGYPPARWNPNLYYRLLQLLLCPASLCAWNAVLRSGLSRPTLWPLQTLARLAIASL